ncbi:unnamed protein product [Tetraodon nigroviridis]|uniref:Syndecan n=2 Tax=Tetraodon nigroviridis TaxID=99883 RepID=Q4RNL2_TETNG|nr:unnamed protein product [Tetraodon nigroviridis]
MAECRGRGARGGPEMNHWEAQQAITRYCSGLGSSEVVPFETSAGLEAGGGRREDQPLQMICVLEAAACKCRFIPNPPSCTGCKQVSIPSDLIGCNQITAQGSHDNRDQGCPDTEEHPCADAHHHTGEFGVIFFLFLELWSLSASCLTFLPAFQEANNEVGAAGPSGDFEIRDDRRNELGRGVSPVDPDLMGNTVEGGSSAAQLPQKNILERKEVLIAVLIGGLLAVVFSDFLVIAVIVGGVVGALFAAFLVMLLVYRMKKKDEGSYTLEEPKQATVTYQKPDKQEEFYA